MGKMGDCCEDVLPVMEVHQAGVDEEHEAAEEGQPRHQLSQQVLLPWQQPHHQRAGECLCNSQCL